MIIDCDMHVIEPANLWLSMGLKGNNWSALEHPLLELPEEYKQPPDAFQYTHGIAKQYRDGYENGWDAPSTLRAMDREKIHKALLLPTKGLLAITLVAESGTLLRICDLYNDWISSYCSLYPKRLLWAALTLPGAVNTAIPEHCSALVTRPNLIRSRHDWQVFDAAEKANIPLVLHEGTTPTQPGLGFKRAANRLEAHIMGHPFEAMAAVTHLTVGGILRRHPNLRVLICEAGSWWRPGFLNRLDEEALGVNGYGHYTADYRPSTYAKQIWQTGEPPYENTVFGSDYPHGDSRYPRSHILITDKEMTLMTISAQSLLYGP